MSTRASKPAGQTPKHSRKHTTKHLKRPMHLRDEGERALASRGIRPWHVALSVVITASLVVAGLHTDAIADVLGLSATAEPEQVTETTQPAANDAATADATGAAASGASEELASAERETEETGRAAAEEAAREADEAAARAAEEERASGSENGSGGGCLTGRYSR